MGFRQCNNDEKKLADLLGLDVDTVSAALKKSRRGGYARIWSIEDKGKYSLAKVSFSKKRDDKYETDFQDGFVRLIGSAHDKAKELNVTKSGVAIQVTSCEVTTPYNPETRKSYTNYAIFAFDIPDGYTTSSSAVSSAKETPKVVDVDEEDEDLPF